MAGRLLRRLGAYFFRGLLFVAPTAVTVYVVYFVFVKVDQVINVHWLLDRRIPGAGIALTVVLITLTGFLASNFATRWLFGLLDEWLARLPLVKLLYTSLRELLDAFVHKRFDRPVLVRLSEESSCGAIGFLTREDLGTFGLEGQVAVYLPQAYNFAGQLVVVPAARVRPLALDTAAAMTFVVSGGVAGEPSAGPARTAPTDRSAEPG
ncbi:MAG TPA: DUF502 domain-containing protein [Candidatus Polarisedimenticolaceae bacterium]|nr:DUF502 domain-containing protein [Candidatus Polarisedimenticolaceae bacterium]